MTLFNQLHAQEVRAISLDKGGGGSKRSSSSPLRVSFVSAILWLALSLN